MRGAKALFSELTITRESAIMTHILADTIKEDKAVQEVDSLGKKSFRCALAGSDDKESTCNAGDTGSIPGLGRSPEEGNGYPF